MIVRDEIRDHCHVHENCSNTHQIAELRLHAALTIPISAAIENSELRYRCNDRLQAIPVEDLFIERSFAIAAMPSTHASFPIRPQAKAARGNGHPLRARFRLECRDPKNSHGRRVALPSPQVAEQ